MLSHGSQQSLQQVTDEFIQPVNLVSSVELHVQRHLVITAPTGMHFLAYVTDFIDQARLDEAMDVLVLVSDGQLAGHDGLPDFFQPFDYLVTLGVSQDFLLGEHLDVSDAATDVLW